MKVEIIGYRDLGLIEIAGMSRYRSVILLRREDGVLGDHTVDVDRVLVEHAKFDIRIAEENLWVRKTGLSIDALDRARAIHAREQIAERMRAHRQRSHLNGQANPD